MDDGTSKKDKNKKPSSNNQDLEHDADMFDYYEFRDIINLSKQNPSLKKALDTLWLIYYTVKDDK